MIRHRSVVAWIAVAALAHLPGLGVPGQARGGTASFESTLRTTLVSGPAIENKYGFATFAGFGDRLPPPDPGFGDHFNDALVNLSTITAGVRSDLGGTGEVTGAPGDPAHAEAYARSVQWIRVLNLTGTGGLRPEVVSVELTLTIDYALTVFAETSSEQATAGFEVYVNGLEAPLPPQLLELSIVGPDAGFQMMQLKIPIKFDLAANSSKTISVSAIAYGSADSDPPFDPPPPPPPPPALMIPEPASVVMLGISLLGLIGGLSRSRARSVG